MLNHKSLLLGLALLAGCGRELPASGGVQDPPAAAPEEVLAEPEETPVEVPEEPSEPEPPAPTTATLAVCGDAWGITVGNCNRDGETYRYHRVFLPVG